MLRIIKYRIVWVALGLIAGIIIGAGLFVFGIIPLHTSTPTEVSQDTQVNEDSIVPGRWGKAGKRVRSGSISNEQKEAIRKLQSLGYLAGSQPATEKSGITINHAAKAYRGLNLVVSGHAPEASLMNMSGDILHTWKCDVYRAWPNFKPSEKELQEQKYTHWRRAFVMPNGDLLAIFERIGLLKLDKQSRLLWAERNNAHHDLDIAENGNLYVLTGEAHINPKFNPNRPIWEDYIAVLNSKGKELKRVSVLEALWNSDYVAVLQRALSEGDILHTNTIEIIKGSPVNPKTPFRKGTVLISIRKLDLVCAVDMDKKTVYWAESSLFHLQHQPTLLDNGNLLVFDNNRTKTTSAVIEFDPVSRQVKWSYVGGKDGVLFSDSCGSCQRLANGNTLITETDAGRAFEVSPDKKIVWEYVNPYRAGTENELIASLFEVVRLRKDFPVDWMK
jgi:hypothetical protein